jgi:toxin secretion/phage lysis holin
MVFMPIVCSRKQVNSFCALAGISRDMVLSHLCATHTYEQFTISKPTLISLSFTSLAIGHIIDKSVIGDGSVIRTAVIFFYLSNEGVSILENAAHIGLPVPQKLKNILKQLHNRSDKED